MKSVNIKLIYVFLILCRPLLCWASIDYCSLCENGFHTMCLYPRDGPGPSCLDYRKVEFTQYQKMYIVDIHNDIRNHVASGLETKGKLGNQPPATNMLQLEWSDELAKIAQRWADQCIPVNATKQHDTCKTTSQFDNVGQNILTAVTNGTDVSELAILILNWYKQVVNVIPSDIDHFEGIKRGQFLIGQYTQLVWANTKAVGCGMSIYKDSPRGFYNQRLVCNYGPGGNIIGQPVYLQGIPCTGCPKGRCNNIRKYLCESLVTENSTNQSKDDNPFPDQNFNNNVISCLLKLEFSEENLYKCKNLTNRNTTDYPTETATVYNNFLTDSWTSPGISKGKEQKRITGNKLRKMFRPPKNGDECVCLLELH
ncbi:venom allergen 3-like isoform X2 [Diorhabda carinulata]|uniref:venom allergen 3-like isoform X2 n=1 Tax=Diorhabda carinulata TaxID=1163345 RepID=UPI0025A12F68|nr:venom allergen 3-like isoform X2 [Diorhabda carinulata]